MSSQVSHPSNKSGTGTGLLLVLFSLAFVIGPAFLGDLAGGLSKALITLFGVLGLLAGTVIISLARLYQKASANVAYVRTGSRGRKVIMDGGGFVIPALHTITPVNLETMRLEVKRENQEALITGDNLRADIHAEFFIRIEREEHSVLQAATSLGAKSLSAEAITDVVSEKLVSALRTVAATMTLNELHTKRDDFASAVRETLKEDLRHNGLTLETVTISHLDQTDPGRLKVDSNIFDAQGARRIAEITQAQRVARNEIERSADKRVKEQDVERDQFIFQQEVSQANAKALRDKEVEQAKAASLVAEQERDQAVELALKKREQQVGVAEQQRQQAEQEAEIIRTQAVEVAERQKQITLAEKERERAEAEARKLEAERDRQEAEQAVETVKVEAAALREKQRTVIAKEAEAESQKVQLQTHADIEAYKTVKIAEAERQSAEAKASARLKLAQAELEAQKFAAEGEQAVEMVPVNVAARQVEVEKQKVDVLRSELEAKSQHQEIAAQLQIEIARIAANKESAVAFAQALGEALGKANLTIWGDPSTVAQVSRAFAVGQTNGAFLHGLANTTPQEVKTAVADGLSGLATMGAGLLAKLTGQEVDPAVVERWLRTTRSGNDQPEV